MFKPKQRPLLRDELIGTRVLVNDKSGNGYIGMLVAFDESMLRLERSGLDLVKFVDGKSKGELSFDWLNLPAGEVQFLAEVG
ncbi:MAG: hypothetical protein AAGA65_09090 [Actinomycetota bacterium]